MGEWIYRKANEHKCDYPKFALPSGTDVGDIWQCSCNKMWRVEKMTLHKGDPRDQREPDYYTATFVPVTPLTPSRR